MQELLAQDPDKVSQEEERRLQAEHDKILQMKDWYWHQGKHNQGNPYTCWGLDNGG